MHSLDVPWTIINFVPFVILIDKIELVALVYAYFEMQYTLVVMLLQLLLPSLPPPSLVLVVHSWCIHWCIFNVLHVRNTHQISWFSNSNHFLLAMNMNRKWKKQQQAHRHTFVSNKCENTVAIAIYIYVWQCFAVCIFVKKKILLYFFFATREPTLECVLKNIFILWMQLTCNWIL